MRFSQLSSLVLFLVSPAVVFANDQMIRVATDSLVGLLLDTETAERPKTRQIHYVKDKTSRALVFVTTEDLESRKNPTFYLAVFEPSWKADLSHGKVPQHQAANISKYRLVGYLPVGGNGWRSVDFTTVKVEKNQITLQTKEYATTDPSCCPTKVGTAIYKIEQSQLIEMKPTRSF